MGLTGSDKALMYALGNVMRGGASRGGYHSGHPFITIGGIRVGTIRDDARIGVAMDSLTITDVLDETPNTCSMKLIGGEHWGGGAEQGPPLGSEIIITLGSSNTLVRDFAGVVLAKDKGYDLTPANPAVILHGIDYTYLLDRRLVLGRYLSTSATTIALDLISRFTSGFTGVHVQAGLDSVDEITFTNQTVSGALTALAKRVGAYWYIDYARDLHFFITDTTDDTDPRPLTLAHPSLGDVTETADLSQVVSRMYVEGGGANALATCAAGTTAIPVEDGSRYNPGGGVVISGPQRIAYASIRLGGGGTLVGPGAQPVSPPVATPVNGAGLGVGLYGYAYTFVTASGESLPSPVTVAETTNGLAPPPALVAALNPIAAAPYVDIGTHDYVMTWVTAAGESLPGPASNGVTTTATNQIIEVSPLPIGPAIVIGRRIYRRFNGSGPYKLVSTQTDNTNTYFGDGVPNAGLGVAAPAVDTTGARKVTLTAVATGPAAVTARKIYRTTANGVPLKLLVTLGNNTATTYSDTTADASLGVAAPATDTSALSQPSGQVLAGATSLVVAGAGVFVATGGWAVVGNGSQVISYTGISGNTLTGIPAAGEGAITASIAYNSSITEAPTLRGIPASGTGAIVQTIVLGDPVNLLVQVEDVAAQAALATQLGGDGVQEEYLQDGRLSYMEASARALAKLAQQNQPLLTLAYRCRDRNTRAGRTVSATLEVPHVSGLYKIQHVTIGAFGPHVMPTYTVTASSSRFSFEDLLRVLRGTV
jgi:hypothetical protein